MGEPANPSGSRPAGSHESVMLFYDGRCSVCNASARAIERMDRGRERVRVVDFRMNPERAHAAGITDEQLEASMHLIDADGRVSAGPDAVRGALRALRLGGLAWTLSLPVVGGLFARAYDVFARNRLRWFGRGQAGDACDTGSCRVER